jgi:hypothetical protein
MSSDEKPKTAVELAMERLRQKDADTGVVEKPITEERKAAVAEARSLHASKIAEVEILHRSKIGGVHDPDDRVKAEAEYRRELQRLNDDLERKIERIRREGD